MTFSVSTGHEAGHEVVRLQGPDGSTCVVVPTCGSQLATLCLSAESGAPAVDVLWAPPVAQLARAGYRAGAPILFPFPGRIARGTYTFRGKPYQVSGGQQRHPLHGFVGTVPWQVVEAGADEAAAWVRTRVTHAELRLPPTAFPGLYVLEVTHRLQADGYEHWVHVTNVGGEAFPFGYGWHPYWRAPLAPGGRRGDCSLQLPAAARWELTAELLPTGRRLEVSGPYDLRQGAPLGEKSYDDPFTLLTREVDGSSWASLVDPAAGLRLTVWAGPAFGHWVVYSPRGTEAVCLEPYTCAPDAFNLQERGIPAGRLELEPGAEWSERLGVRLTRA